MECNNFSDNNIFYQKTRNLKDIKGMRPIEWQQIPDKQKQCFKNKSEEILASRNATSSDQLIHLWTSVLTIPLNSRGILILLLFSSNLFYEQPEINSTGFAR